MASITKRGNSYTVRYYYQNDQGEMMPGWETFSSEKEAKERKQRIEIDLREGTFLIPTDITVRELLEKWMPIQSAKHKWTPKTYQSTEGNINNLICPYIGNLVVQKIKPYHIEQFFTTLAKTPCGQYKLGVKKELTPKQEKRLLSGTTLHEVYSLLRTAFTYAVKWEIIRKSPVLEDAPAKTTEEREIWNAEEAMAALNTISDPLLHLAVHLCFIGSLREGELVGITPEDLDFEGANGQGTISINKALQRADKNAMEKTDPRCIVKVFPDKREGSKSSLILKKTKNKTSKRTIFMTEPLKAELKTWLTRLKEDEAREGQRYQNSGMLFRLPTGLAVEGTLIRKWFEKWRDENPEFEKIVFHAIRHSSATYQLEISDGDIKAVQGNTGHAKADVLVNTYAHIQTRSRQELAHKMEQDFYGHSAAVDEAGVPMLPAGVSITTDAILEAIQGADPEAKQKLVHALFA